MKKILLCIGIWMIINLCSIFVLGEKTSKEYGAGVNIISFPLSILATAAIYHYKQKKEEEDIELIEEKKEEEVIDTRKNDTSSFTEENELTLIHKALKQSEELKEVIMNEDYSYEEFVSASGNVRISNSMFSEIRDVAIAMLQVLRDACNQKEFLDLLRKASHTNGAPDAYLFNLKSMFIKDIVRCYDEMGYAAKASFRTAQGQALYIIIRFWSDDTETYSFSMEDYCIGMESDILRKECIRNVNKQINIYKEFKTSATSTVGLNDFNTMLTLALYKDEITEYFRMLIFRLCQLFAKMDGNVTEKEKNWLKQILKMQELLEEQYTDESGNPLPKQPKKEWIKKAEAKLESIQKVTSKHLEEQQQEVPKLKENTSFDKLNELIGLSETKKEIHTLSNFILMKQKREKEGLKSPDISYHCVFTGNPGTGKTTVARILADIYKDLGILKEGHLIETDRSGLVAEYVGQTAVKTNKIIDEALDGVLFIDEAYSLVQGGKEDYGKEAIATLLKRMEDDRNRLVVILAGYTNEIEEFINSNPGLRSRFNRYIHFADYTAEELYDIFCLMMKKNEYTLSSDAGDFLKRHFADIVTNKPKDFGNARYVRNLFERTIENQSNRLADDPNLTKEKLAELRKDDFIF